MEWVVENAVTAVPSGAARLPENTSDHKTICMIYPKGYKRDINVSGDIAINGASLHLWLRAGSHRHRRKRCPETQERLYVLETESRRSSQPEDHRRKHKIDLHLFQQKSRPGGQKR